MLTLRDELELIAHHLREVSDDVAAVKEQTRALRIDSAGAPLKPSPATVAAMDDSYQPVEIGDSSRDDHNPAVMK